MPFTRLRTTALFCALLGPSPLLGCNGVLGIREPSDWLLDAGIPKDAATDEEHPEDPPVLIDGGAPPLEETPRFPEWPMPNPTGSGLQPAQSFDLAAQEIAVDEVTGLGWQREIDDEPRTWRDAATYCAELAIGGGGFHLPSRIELLSLIDFTSDPSIDAEAFPDTPGDYFWSSSRYAGDRTSAWVVNFGSGPGFVSSSATDSLFRVRCVRREAPDARDSQYLVGPDGDTVLDVATSLQWQREPAAMPRAWSDAVAYCTGLALDGKGWHLPTIKELQTLVDEAKSMPAIDGRAFPKTAPEYFWSSSRVVGAEHDAWAVSFRFGFDGPSDVAEPRQVRCVR